MESLWGFVIIVFLLICVISTVYAIFVSSPYKRDDNADFGEMDIETLKKLLKERLEYPYCKNISINEEGDIDLVCKYATYAVKIEDRKLVVNNKFRPFAKAGNIEEEKDCLEAHLVKIILPEVDINTPRALGHFRRYLKARIISRISGWLFLILLILYSLNKEGIHITDVMDIWTSKGVSMMQFTEYSDKITIGEALRAACPEGKWSSDKIDKGLYRVAFNGYGMNGSLLTIVFQSKDWSECTIQSIAMDGQDCSLLEGMLLEALFENAGDGDSSGQIDGQGLLEAADEYIEEADFATDGMEVTGEDRVDLSEQPVQTVDDSEIDQTAGEDAYDSEVQGDVTNLLDAQYIDTIAASSELTDGGNTYKVEALFDGSKDTCWAEGVDGNGVGEYIEIHFIEPVYVNKICFLNGYMKNEDVFNKNGKIKRVEMAFSDGYSCEQSLGDRIYSEVEDQSYSDWIYFESPVCTEYLKVTILDAEAGEKYSDICLSELALLGYPQSATKGVTDDSIPAWELSGHYGGIIGGQSVMDISMYSEDTVNGSIGYADIYVEGGEYSYQAELYEASTNLYWVAADTDEEVALSAYRDGTDIIVQLYVDGECITEYLLVGQFQS